MRRRRAAGIAAAVTGVLGLGCSSDDSADVSVPETLLVIRGSVPGDVVGLAVDDARNVVSWMHRTDGTIHELPLPAGEATAGGTDEARVVATVDVSGDSDQGGLLDQLLLPDGSRVLTWTTADGNELVVGTLDVDGADEPTIVWSAGATGNGAIGGKLDLAADRDVLVSIGRNTAWDDATDTDGALLRFDPALTPGVEPDVVSVGYTNPWAFESITSTGGAEEIWVWDNAAGPDPADPDAEDVERRGRADLGDRSTLARSATPDRAPAAMVELPDGRLGVCGFLDNELRAYEIVDGPDGPRTVLERAGTIMPCDTAAALAADGTIVTAALTPDGEALLVLRP